MFDGWKPDIICRDVLSLDLNLLRDMGVSAMVFDLDNTLTLWNDMDFSPELAVWMDECRELGFSACICSNNHPERIAPVAEALGLEYVADAGKPGRGAYMRACSLLGASPEHTVAVGDQLMTDVIGAKRQGLRAALVNPLGRREFLGTYFNRVLEKALMRAMGIRRA